MIRWLLNLAALTAGLFTLTRRRRSPGRAEPAGAEPDANGWVPWLKRWGLRMGVLLAVLAAGGFLVAASGIVPIKASSGHWAITEWFLRFSKQRSVATHTLGPSSAPALEKPALVLKGAGHYDTGCRPCHGSPVLPEPRIAQRMTPAPPYLPQTVARWKDDELFYIVKHGIKFTGMPAWPALHRDDEVWAMVAFLRALPQLDAAAYRQLAHGASAEPAAGAPMQDVLEPVQTPRPVAESCARCHGADGLGRGEGAFPRLASQRPTYLFAALRAYARGERHSGIMQPIAAGLSREDMRALADFYADQDAPPAAPSPRADAAAIERGKEIALRGIPRQRVPSCMDCHGPVSAADTSAAFYETNAFYPALAGQYADYLVLQLELFKENQRGGSAYAHLMDPVATRLTPEQMRDVALYYESLGR